MSGICAQSYFPNYYSFDDIFVTQERVPVIVKTRIPKMGFLDPGEDAEDLEPGKTVNLPLWYVKELSSNNPYFIVQVPDIYKNVHKAVCEADSTHIELGKLHPYFYEYGRYLTSYDRNNIIGQIVFETCRQRVRHLLDIAKNVTNEMKPEHKLENLENRLYESGARTSNMFAEWLQYKKSNIEASTLVQEHTKKRKRTALSEEDSPSQSSKK